MRTPVGGPKRPVYINTKGVATPCESDIGIGGGGSTVVGSIVPYMGEDTPDGFLFCDGSEVGKAAYSELYAVIGDRFGTSTDPSKFKLPKIDDARYLQGSTVPGTSVAEELPNITGMFGNCEERSSSISGAFSIVPTTGGAAPHDQGGQNIEFDASKSSPIYKDDGHVVPNSVTVRYLICYKKVIAKVDAMVGMPDYSSAYTQDETADFVVKEDGYMICSIVMGSSWDTGVTGGDVLINDKNVWHWDRQNNYHDRNPSSFLVSKGDVVKIVQGVTSVATIHCRVLPLKASPAKISELFMGAPDWANAKQLTVEVNKEYTVEEDGFINCRLNPGHMFIKKDTDWIDVCDDGEEDDIANTNTIPVSKGDKYKFSCENPDGSGMFIAKNIHFIPRKKIQIDVSDVIATGSGGVIDGTLLNDPTSSDSKWSGTITETAQPVYTVKNDCALVIDESQTDKGFSYAYYLDEACTKPIWKHDESRENAIPESWCSNPILIKKRTQVWARRENVTTTATGQSDLTFYEYKLQSLAPQIAMPDYNAEPVPVSSGWIATDNGWIVFNHTGITSDGIDHLFTGYINNKQVYCSTHVHNKWCGSNTNIVPISKGDVVTAKSPNETAYPVANYITLSFYPCKSVQQSHPTDCVSYVVETGRFSSVDGTTHATASENDSWYRLYSDGWCEMGGKKTYLASTGTNTEIVTLAKSFLDTSFTLTFGAGSSGHASDDHHVVNEDQNYRTVNTFGIRVIDPNASTEDAWNCWRAEGFVK